MSDMSDALDRSEALAHGYHVNEKLNENVFSTVYGVNLLRAPEVQYVMKAVKFPSYLSDIVREQRQKQLQKEVEIQRQLGDLNMAPDVIEWWLTRDAGFIISERLQETAKSLLLNASDQLEKEAVIQAAFDAIKELHRLGFYHGDTHLVNIMWNDKEQKFMFIDTEESGKITYKYAEDESIIGLTGSSKYKINQDIQWFLEDVEATSNLKP